MISRKNRFHGHNAVSKVRGSAVRMPGFSVFYATNSKRSDYRLAVVVSKKIAKSAVKRNRIRRRIFETVRKSGLLVNVPVDAVIVVKDIGVKDISQIELDMQIQKVCQKMI